jgi:predicted nucleotidyltransferase component of viral defense system
MSKPKNHAHSVKQKLLNLAQSGSGDFQMLLTKYALERFLARLSQSEFRNEFVLKGAMLFQIWSESFHRSTRDLDFLSFGSNQIPDLVGKIKKICSVDISEDGISFDLEKTTGEKIKEDQEYEGIRLHIPAFLERTRIALRIDVGFGDVVNPSIQEADFPTLLNFSSPKIRTYPPETVIAEKFQALVDLGITNSRLKDFYDLHFLTRNFQFDRKVLVSAINATFEKRNTKIPLKVPTALTKEFSSDENKKAQWKSFLRKSNISEANTLEQTINELRVFFGKLFDFQ